MSGNEEKSTERECAQPSEVILEIPKMLNKKAVLSRRKKIFPHIAVGIFLSALVLGFFWAPYLDSNGPLLQKNDQRSAFIIETVTKLAQKTGTSLPKVVIAGYSSSATSPIGQAVLSVDRQMLAGSAYSEDDIAAVVAHELGHIKNRDTLRFWTRWNRVLSEKRELRADEFAGSLVGCVRMTSFFENHKTQVEAGFHDQDDPHPDLNSRIAAACNTGRDSENAKTRYTGGVLPKAD